EEAREKMRLGMTIFIREGTAARNLEALLEAVTPETSHRSCFCTDDRHPATLLDEGHIDSIIRKAVHLGLEPVQAIRMATLNTALYFRLHDRGAIAPGKRADLVVFTDLSDLHAEMVFREGRLVARDGVLIGEPRVPSIDDAAVRDTVRVDFSSVDLTIPAKGERARVIGVVPGQIITEHLVEPIGACDGKAVAEPGRDILKIAVIERHKGTGRVGLGFVRGMGLTAGALATTVAHDHHNLIVAGADDGSMLAAARAVAALGGGEAVARGEEVLATLPLPIAGLMSDRPLEAVRSDQDRLLAAAASLGSPLHDPFMTLSFLGLEVIPTLKLTDIGLVDVERFEPVGLWVEG
ncbi:MAG: adenine deaminase C-terminal domain-containing protein, partial [Planctomycetota bacterium]